MPRATSLSTTLAAPEPLDALMVAAGYVVELVVRRADGRPMTPADRAEAAQLVVDSEERGMTDEQATAIGRPELAAQLAAAAPKASRTKRAAPASTAKAARTARRPKGSGRAGR